jgi:hypothetical protein
MPYKRLIDYLSGMLSWDFTYTSDVDEKDYDSAAFKKDYKAVEQFFNRFDYKKEFATVMRQMLRNEAFFCLPRFEGEKIVLQELPSSPTYTKITGRWDYGLEFSFNMLWFILPGVDLNMYPDFFKRRYANFWGKAGDTNYIPSLPPELRGTSSWVYWQDVPVDVGWCWKLNPEIATRVPYFSPLFSDLILQPLMRNLQKNINMSVASRMIVGEVPFLKDAAAKVKDQISMTPETLGKFLQLVRSALSEALRITAAPLNNMQGVEFKAENDVYSSYLGTALASSGINSNLIFSSDIKPNSVETRLSLNVDEQIATKIYPQFNAFLDYHVNKFTTKYKFKFAFEGTQFYTNRADRFDAQTKLLPMGIILPQKLAASMGMNPFEFEKQLAEARAGKWVDKLTPIISGAQMAGATGGAPAKPESKLTDDGEATKSNSRNVGRKVVGKNK